ncbi:MAG TPA: hypothetical protein PKU80_05095 [Candidatus Limiplasma sp.]|nr:hypothetical protein [Candidatus Limiplasma sp.]HRX09088.1 hypothetical protein [Candidatus Limiplasma sp.]
MKRLLCVLAAMTLLISGAAAQSEPEDSSLLGVVYFPRGATEESASFAFRYRLPQLAADRPQAEAFNGYFASYAADIVETLIPATLATLGELPAPGEPEYYVNLDYRVASRTADQQSVLLISQQFFGNTLVEQWVSVVFALSGIYAGQPITLSQAMGLEEGSGSQTGDTASELVYGLVWQIIQYDIGSMKTAYFPDLTEDEFRLAFSPQDDFYFDTDGNFVFFIQAGTIAGEVEGVLQFPFSLGELLSGNSENQSE